MLQIPVSAPSPEEAQAHAEAQAQRTIRDILTERRDHHLTAAEGINMALTTLSLAVLDLKVKVLNDAGLYL